MLRFWPLLFIVLPLVELYLIIEIGSRIGALWTVLLVVTTAIIGIQLLRFQSFSTLRRAQLNMSQGSLPAMEMMEGMVLAVGGALLITPGFLTDTLGFLCLLPVTRRAMIRYAMSNATVHMAGGHSGRTRSRSDHQTGSADSDQVQKGVGRTLEGEFERKDR